MKNPKTISHWLKLKEQYKEEKQKALDNKEIWNKTFELGHLMPVVGNWQYLAPKGKIHLFEAKPARSQKIIDENHVSTFKRGRWKNVSRGKHIINVVSIAVFAKNKLEWLVGPSDVVKKFILPNGWVWKKDELGICAVDTEEVDYHPYWTQNITIEHILQGHAENKEKRKLELVKKAEKEQFELLFKRDVKNTYVLLEDSRRVGNCVEGTLQWAENRLKISRDEILACPHLFRVNANLLFCSGDSRAILAAKSAYQRETTISI